MKRGQQFCLNYRLYWVGCTCLLFWLGEDSHRIILQECVAMFSRPITRRGSVGGRGINVVANSEAVNLR